MKNKKGFVFVETIIVCSILAVSLVAVYAAFVLIIHKQEKRNKYDLAIYNYRIYNVGKILKDKLFDEETNPNCQTNSGDILNKLDSNIKEKLEVSNLYYVWGKDFASVSYPGEHNFREYVNTLVSKESCVLIGEFKTKNPNTKEDEYFYSSVFIESKD